MSACSSRGERTRQKWLFALYHENPNSLCPEHFAKGNYVHLLAVSVHRFRVRSRPTRCGSNTLFCGVQRSAPLPPKLGSRKIHEKRHIGRLEIQSPRFRSNL